MTAKEFIKNNPNLTQVELMVEFAKYIGNDILEVASNNTYLESYNEYID
jgi:hypothetical protein